MVMQKGGIMDSSSHHVVCSWGSYYACRQCREHHIAQRMKPLLMAFVALVGDSSVPRGNISSLASKENGITQHVAHALTHDTRAVF